MTAIIIKQAGNGKIVDDKPKGEKRDQFCGCEQGRADCVPPANPKGLHIWFKIDLRGKRSEFDQKCTAGEIDPNDAATFQEWIIGESLIAPLFDLGQQIGMTVECYEFSQDEKEIHLHVYFKNWAASQLGMELLGYSDDQGGENGEQ